MAKLLHLRPAVAAFESALLSRVLERTDGNVALAARQLGVPPPTIWRKLKRYGIKPELYRPEVRRVMRQATDALRAGGFAKAVAIDATCHKEAIADFLRSKVAPDVWPDFVITTIETQSVKEPRHGRRGSRKR